MKAAPSTVGQPLSILGWHLQHLQNPCRERGRVGWRSLHAQLSDHVSGGRQVAHNHLPAASDGFDGQKPQPFLVTTGRLDERRHEHASAAVEAGQLLLRYSAEKLDLLSSE